MGRPYSDDLRVRVVAAMEDGGDCRTVGATFGIAPSTAGNWHRLYRRTQSYSARPMGEITGPSCWIISPMLPSCYQVAAICAWLMCRPIWRNAG